MKRLVSIVATAGLALTGLVAMAGGPAQAVPTDTNYMMKLTTEHGTQNYLTYPGIDVFMYNNGYNGTFGDEHLSGITLTHYGKRIAGNGDIHLLPVPEQWDAASPATSSNRTADGAAKTFDYNSNTITGRRAARGDIGP
jgi:hypothetical protein